MPSKPLSFRPNVCMLVYSRDGKLLLGERFGKRGHWQFPQGGIEPGHSAKDSVVRELREELGIHKRHLGKIVRLKSRHQYEWRTPPSYAVNKWRGQRQTFWLIQFLGDDRDIDLKWHHDPEFRTWRWCTVTEVRRRAARFRLKGYQGPLKEFLALKRAKKVKIVSIRRER